MAASTDLCSLADLKTHLGVSGSDDDALLGQLIDQVSEAIERFCGRKFAGSAAYTEQHDGGKYGRTTLFVDHPSPDLAVTTLKDDLDRDFDDPDTTYDTDNYTVYAEEGRIQLVEGNRFADGHRNVEVVYTSGWDTIPDDVELSCMISCGQWYNQASAQGKQSEKIGDYAVSFRAGSSAAALPAEAKELLKPYRLVRI